MLAENALKCQKELEFLCANWRTETHRKTHTHTHRLQRRSDKVAAPDCSSNGKHVHNSRKMRSLRVSFASTHLCVFLFSSISGIFNALEAVRHNSFVHFNAWFYLTIMHIASTSTLQRALIFFASFFPSYDGFYSPLFT